MSSKTVKKESFDSEETKVKSIQGYKAPVTNDDGSVTVYLSKPIKATTGETLECITIEEPLAEDVMSLDAKASMKDLLAIASRRSGVVATDMKRIKASDAMQIVGVVSDFLFPGQETGTTF